MKINPLFLCDFYKTGHIRQYPEGTTEVYSNFTPRSNKYAYKDSKEIVVFGIQYLVKEYLVDLWTEGFFDRPKEEMLEEYKSLMDRCLGPDSIPVDHIAELHDLGYLPIHMKALPEGTLCPIGVPCLTIKNTKPKFFWLTNYLETLFSNILWKPMTSATTAHMYRKEFERHAEKTGSPKDFIGWQGHDFSFRGMSGIEDACMSGGGHLLSFNGTDTVPAIKWLEQYYPSDELIGGSVPATEHSVMSMGTEYITMDDGTKIPNEFKSFKRLITELYPTGIISIVSDTFDFWKAMTEYLPRLKDKILARDGRVVIRPDSGDPADIICGLNGSGTFEESKRYYASGDDEWCNRDITETEYKGAYELLYDTFGGTVNEQGYKVLNPKVGLIYGDSINYDRQRDILARLEAKGFTASNLVLGIGSFTYEYVTRDTYGFAMKATHGVVNGEHKDIYKDPKTDDGLKKSAKGLLMVYRDDKGDIKLKDQCTQAEEQSGLLETVLHDGTYITESLTTIRKRLNNQL